LKLRNSHGTEVLETEYLVTVHASFEKCDPLCSQLQDECKTEVIDAMPQEAFSRYKKFYFGDLM
jgi:hypothetical protein